MPVNTNNRRMRKLPPPVLFLKRSWKTIVLTAAITWGTENGLEFISAPWHDTASTNETPAVKYIEFTHQQPFATMSPVIRCPHCESLLLIDTAHPNVRKIETAKFQTPVASYLQKDQGNQLAQ